MRTYTKSICAAFVWLVACISFMSAQAPSIEWQKTIGGNWDDYARKICHTDDGGYLLAGYSSSGVSSEKTDPVIGGIDIWIVKINSVGTIKWQKTIGGDADDYLVDCQTTSDGGFILGTQTLSGMSGDKTDTSRGFFDGWVIKLDSTGNIEWQRTLGGSDLDAISSIKPTHDGGYIVSAMSISPVSGDKTVHDWGEPGLLSGDYWIIKLDATGNIQWQYAIGGLDGDVPISIVQLIDGNYVVAGYSDSGIGGDKTETYRSFDLPDYWVVKFNEAGEIIWQKTIGGNNMDLFTCMDICYDGGFILSGFSQSYIDGDKSETNYGGYDFWIVKLTSDGAIEWENTIGGSGYDAPWVIKQTWDGGFIAGGSSTSDTGIDKADDGYGSTGDYWVVKLNSYGSIVWQKTIGGFSFDELRDVVQTSDSGFMLIGDSESGISGDKTDSCRIRSDYWVMKLGPDFLGVNDPGQSNLNDQMQIYPNPANDFIIISTNGTNNKTFQLIDIAGRNLKSFFTSEEEITIDVSDLPAGLYLIQMNDNGNSFIKEFVKE